MNTSVNTAVDLLDACPEEELDSGIHEVGGLTTDSDDEGDERPTIPVPASVVHELDTIPAPAAEPSGPSSADDDSSPSASVANSGGAYEQLWQQCHGILGVYVDHLDLLKQAHHAKGLPHCLAAFAFVADNQHNPFWRRMNQGTGESITSQEVDQWILGLAHRLLRTFGLAPANAWSVQELRRPVMGIAAGCLPIALRRYDHKGLRLPLDSCVESPACQSRFGDGEIEEQLGFDEIEGFLVSCRELAGTFSQLINKSMTIVQQIAQDARSMLRHPYLRGRGKPDGLYQSVNRLQRLMAKLPMIQPFGGYRAQLTPALVPIQTALVNGRPKSAEKAIQGLLDLSRMIQLRHDLEMVRLAVATYLAIGRGTTSIQVHLHKLCLEVQQRYFGASSDQQVDCLEVEETLRSCLQALSDGDLRTADELLAVASN